MEARGDRSVSAERDIGVAVTGDHNVVGVAPAVRSAYWEQVRRIAPAELVDRESELSDLATFCTAESGPAYAWWKAEAWAGKTALMSWFALHPPDGVRIVPFFVTARLGAQNDVVAYVDVVLEQLAELVGEGVPGYLTEETREAHLLRMYRESARACAERGERLILIVDGLDEDRGVTTGSDAHSIASLLPAWPEHGMRVVVASRMNPPLPGDVAGGHPLRRAEIVRPMARSSRAEVIRTEAERELKRLIEAGGLEYDLLALVAAAGGGLTALDLATLTESPPYRVRDVLRTQAGRTFGVRADVHLLGHEELQSQAEEILGVVELGCYQAQLHAWADGWRERGWPDTTPEYLLRGYFSMLRSTDDLDRMVGCALDTTRHERMLDATGGDAAALDEIRATQQLMAERTERGEEGDLLTALRLAMHRDELAGRSARISRVVPEAWAVLGQVNRAEALAYSLTEPDSRAAVFMAIASRLADAADRERALTLLTHAQVAVGLLPNTEERDRMVQRLCFSLIGLDECARVAGLVDTLSASRVQEVLVRLVGRHTSEGRFESARETADLITAPRERAQAYGALAAAQLQAGAVDDAESVLRAGGGEARVRAAVLLASAMGRHGDDCAEAGRLLDEAVEIAVRLESPWGIVGALVDAGAEDHAATLANRIQNMADDTAASVRERDQAWAQLVHADAKRGEFDRAESWRARIRDPALSAVASADLAAELVRGDKLQRAEQLAETLDEDQHREGVLAFIAAALVEKGEFADAVDRAGSLLHSPARAHVIVALAEQGARLGEVETAVALIRDLEDAPFMSDTMPRVALALALHGCVPQAEEILYELEAEARDAALVPGDLFTLADALNALAEAGYPDEAVAVVASEPPMLAHLEALVWPDDEFGVDLPLMAGCEVLASVGAFERLEAMVEEAPGHLLILFPLAEALAGTGQIERAQALLASCPDESSGDSVRAAVARGLVLQGDTEAGMEFVRSMADTEKQVGTLSRLARSADSADRHGDAELLLGAAIDLADDTDTPLSWGKTRSLVEALADLGHVKEARSRLATALSGAGADVGVHEFPECARLLAAVGWHEQAETLANGIGDVAIRARTQAEVAEVFAEAAEYDRAERLARRVLPESAAWSAFAAIAAVADEPRARRLVVAALSHVSWTQVLPALLRLDPRVVPLVVRTLSGPVVANSTSATTWKSPIGPKRPIAARTSAPSSK